MDKIILDTHVLLSLFIESSPYFEKAQEIVKDKTVYLPVNILLEYIFLLSKGLKLDESLIWKIVEDIHRNAIVLEISEKDLLEAYLLLKKYDLSIKHINDILLIVFAKRLDLTLVTFDKKLIKIARNEGVKVYD